MKRKISFLSGIIFSFILINGGLAFCQDENSGMPPAQKTSSDEQAVQEVPVETPLVQEAPIESETQWLWGDVVSVDTVAKKILVKYLDYETDTEKEINIEVGDNTSFENVKAIGEIKPMDILSIDYIVSPDGKNIAKNISIEKPEGSEALPQDTAKEEPKVTPASE